MPVAVRRRRVIALLTVLAVGLSSRAIRAQGTGDVPQPPDNMPQNPNEEVSVDIGNWRVTSWDVTSHLIIPDEKLSAAGWTTGEGDKRKGAVADLTVDYWGDYAGDGPLWQGKLTIRTIGNYDPASGRAIEVFPARLLADGVELTRLEVGDRAEVDLTQIFGADLAGLVPVQRLAVAMQIDGDEHVVYDVALPETEAAFARARAIPDYRMALRRRDSRPQPETPPADGEGCFITTACCELVGLNDDCFELTALRRFRDRVMAATPEGRRDIALYYATAPRVLAEMDRRGERHLLLPLYFTHILPSAILAWLGMRSLPQRLYTSMMRRLLARYLGAAQA